MQKPNHILYFCFSPLVMMVTYVVELVLLLYVLYKYPSSLVKNLVMATLFFLAVFQLSEYGVCEWLGFDQEFWARIGFIAITLLPALGYHLINALSGVKRNLLVKLAYLSAAVWVSLFASVDIFRGFACEGNYAIFQLESAYGYWYYLYYFFWLLIGVLVAYVNGRRMKSQNSRNALFALAAGYMSFMLPTMLINSFYHGTNRGIPSIMCGFAVILAFILVFYVIPQHEKSRRSSKAAS